MTKTAIVSDIEDISSKLSHLFGSYEDIKYFSVHDDLEHLFSVTRYSKVVLITCNRSMRVEENLQSQCRYYGANFLRLYIGTDVAYLGPYVRPDEEGCLKCVTMAERNNHPNRKNWVDLFVDETLPTFKSIPSWNNASLETIFAALKDVLFYELLRDQDGSNGVLVFEDFGRKATLHKVIPHPNCPLCSAIPDDSCQGALIKTKEFRQQAKGKYRVDNERLTTEKLKQVFLDRRFGLVKHVFKDLYSTYMPMYGAEVPIRGSDTIETGFGRAMTAADSEKVALLEALERFVGHAPRRVKTAIRGSYNELKEQALDPRELTLHETVQQKEPGYVFEPYSEDLEYNWVWGHSLRHNKGILVPEQCVYYRLESIAQKTKLNRFVYESSNGCALGGSDEEAVFYGLMEIIERDAYLTAYFAKAPLVELSLTEAEDKNIRFLTERVEALGYSVHVYDMTLETGIPAIWAMIVNPAEDAPVKTYCAAGCHPDPEKAILGALVEVITSIAIYEVSMPEDLSHARAMVSDFSRVQSMHDHIILYSQKEALEWLSFLDNSKPKVAIKDRFRSWYVDRTFGNISEELAKVVKSVLKVANDIIVVKQGYSAMEKVGISCVKVLVPGMLTIYFGQQHRRINLKRISDAAIFRGQTDKPLKYSQLNPRPHNFP